MSMEVYVGIANLLEVLNLLWNVATLDMNSIEISELLLNLCLIGIFSISCVLLIMSSVQKVRAIANIAGILNFITAIVAIIWAVLLLLDNDYDTGELFSLFEFTIIFMANGILLLCHN